MQTPPSVPLHDGVYHGKIEVAWAMTPDFPFDVTLDPFVDGLTTEQVTKFSLEDHLSQRPPSHTSQQDVEDSPPPAYPPTRVPMDLLLREMGPLKPRTLTGSQRH